METVSLYLGDERGKAKGRCLIDFSLCTRDSLGLCVSVWGRAKLYRNEVQNRAAVDTVGHVPWRVSCLPGFSLGPREEGTVKKKKWFIIMGTVNDINLAIVCCDTSPSNGDWWIWWRAQRMADRQVVINLWTRGCGLLLLVMDDWLWDIVTLWPSKRYWDSALFFYFE